MTATATVWRTCPSCGASFGQPDDPGRKRVYCSRACQQAAYRARQRQRSDGWQQRTGRQDQHSGRQEWRSDHRQQRQQRADSGSDGAGQRQRQRQEQRTPPPGGATGQRPSAGSSARPKVMCLACGGLRARGHTVHHDQAAHERARRRHEALLRKAAGTPFPHEAAACRAKAEALRDKYGL